MHILVATTKRDTYDDIQEAVARYDISQEDEIEICLMDIYRPIFDKSIVDENSDKAIDQNLQMLAVKLGAAFKYISANDISRSLTTYIAENDVDVVIIENKRPLNLAIDAIDKDVESILV